MSAGCRCLPSWHLNQTWLCPAAQTTVVNVVIDRTSLMNTALQASSRLDGISRCCCYAAAHLMRYFPLQAGPVANLGGAGGLPLYSSHMCRFCCSQFPVGLTRGCACSCSLCTKLLVQPDVWITMQALLTGWCHSRMLHVLG